MFLIESVNGLYCDWSALLRNFSIINCICNFLDLSSDNPLCNRAVADMKKVLYYFSVTIITILLKYKYAYNSKRSYRPPRWPEKYWQLLVFYLLTVRRSWSKLVLERKGTTRKILGPSKTGTDFLADDTQYTYTVQVYTQ